MLKFVVIISNDFVGMGYVYLHHQEAQLIIKH